MRHNWIADASLLNDFRRCPEYARLRHHVGLCLPGYEEMTGSGTAWHAAMEDWFSWPESQHDDALAALRVAWGDEPEPLFDEEKPFRKRPLELFERMLALYCEKFPRENDPFEVIGNEEYVEGVIGDPLRCYDYCGIRDRKIRFPDGSEYVVDTKSTSANLDRNYFEAYEMSQSLIGYCALELVNGRRCDGFMIDAAHVDQYWRRMTKTKGLQVYGGNPKPEHFVRYGPIKVADWQMTRWTRDTERAIRDLERYLETSDDHPWEHREQGCHSWGKWCIYWNRPGTDLPGICRSPIEMHKQLMDEYGLEYWDPKERGTKNG